MTSSGQPDVPSFNDEVGVQPERTGLAWNRTLVVLAVAFGILGVHAFHDGLPLGLTIISGLIAAVILIASSPIARARSHRASELMSGAIRLMSPAPLLALSGVSFALALASGALIIIRG
jgi:uncharacterized membrane protein YidH (DUF202 family)